MNNNKGSRKWIIEYVNNKTKELNEEIIKKSNGRIDSEIQWKSPISEKNFIEHRDDFLKVLGCNEKIKRDFWPSRGPVWDGLAKDNNGTVLLVEAKAHISEMKSTCKAKAESSINIIKNTLKALAYKYDIKDYNEEVWLNKYYQLANRMAFTDYLNSELKIKTYLVLINFVGDTTNISTDDETWNKHYKEVFEEMGISENKVLDQIIICNIHI